VILIAAIFSLSVTSLCAETYRWKDAEGKLHYGAVVPAEYADQPYDVISKSGIVIKHVEPEQTALEVKAKEEIEDNSALIAAEKRQQQSDRLLLVRYRSEEVIHEELAVEIKQLGYDSKLIDQSAASTEAALREQLRQAADRQRANLPITPEQQKNIDKLYSRRAQDKRRRLSLTRREAKTRARFQTDLERYRLLTAKPDTESTDETPADQG
jgi:hypothetical protein